MRLSWHEREERRAARTDEFKQGVISEEVYRASLFALGYRGDDISMEVRLHASMLPPHSITGIFLCGR